MFFFCCMVRVFLYHSLILSFFFVCILDGLSLSYLPLICFFFLFLRTNIIIIIMIVYASTKYYTLMHSDTNKQIDKGEQGDAEKQKAREKKNKDRARVMEQEREPGRDVSIHINGIQVLLKSKHMSQTTKSHETSDYS